MCCVASTNAPDSHRPFSNSFPLNSLNLIMPSTIASIPTGGSPGSHRGSSAAGSPIQRIPGPFARLFKSLDWQVNAARASTWLSLLAAMLAIAAVALHVPGQASMDTSIALEEARVGRSVSWGPPFMSALLRWLGGGEIATAAFVLLCCAATYGSLAIASRATLARRIAAGSPYLSAWRLAIVSLLFLNPVIFIYVGIVWKDVLLASTLMAGTAAAYAAWASRGWAALAWAIGSWTLLAVGMDIRQQGIFMSPCLALVPLAALANNPATKRLPAWGRCLLGLVVFLSALIATRSAVQVAIQPPDGTLSNLGYQIVMNFDLAGMVCKSTVPTAELAVPITDEQRAAVRSSHASDRIDKVGKNPIANIWFGSLGDKRFHYWLAMVKQNPMSYLRHRLEAFGFLLNVEGIDGCLPLCIGVEGNPDFLKQSGIPAVRDARDRLLYRVAATYFNWPIYRHWFWLLVLMAAGGNLWRIGVHSAIFHMAWPIAAACFLLYLSYLPTALACDFRYLYPVIPLLTLVWCLMLLGATPARSPRPN